jgi:hypothetical protein
MKKAFTKIILGISRFFMHPSIRYTRGHNCMRMILNYNNTENNFRKGLRFLKMNRVKGDYAEFGVFNGSSFITAYHLAQLERQKNMKFYAFDSFEGLPKPERKDINSDSDWKKGDFSCSLENFKRNLKRGGVNMNKVVCIKGEYKKSLKKQHNPRKLAFILIDCDYYSSAKDVLNYIKQYLQRGTIVLFDDWYAFKASKEQGEQKAFNEFLKKNKNISFVDFSAYGCQKMFICLKD